MRTSVPSSSNLRAILTRSPARLFGNGRLQDVLLAGLAVAVISLMVLPLPAVLLDGLISINIGLSVLLLMMAMYARSPLALSTFPTLLLFTTLFRLSLNKSIFLFDYFIESCTQKFLSSILVLKLRN